MLDHPPTLVASVRDSNMSDSVFFDWLETMSMFILDDLSLRDVMDYLLEEQILESQDSAINFLQPAWLELQNRHKWLGSEAPFRMSQNRIERKNDWRTYPAYSYCLVVSHGCRYNDWHSAFGGDYNRQGDLFEEITLASMHMQLPRWKFCHTGWSLRQKQTPQKLVADIANFLAEGVGNVNVYLPKHGKDMGVDLVSCLPYPDRRGGMPIYLTQCASGKDWTSKVNEPNMSEWKKILEFCSTPNKALSIPFALDHIEFRRQSNRSEGLLMDRYRLLACELSEDSWVPSDLANRVIEWLSPRVDWLISKLKA